MIVGVPGLDPGGHGAAGEREELVPVDAEQLDPAAVEVEPVEGERGLAEPGPDPVIWCTGAPSTSSVAVTWYSFGWSMSHSVMSPSPDSVAVTVTWPASVITTGTRAEAIVRAPSTSSTATCTVPAGPVPAGPASAVPSRRPP